MLGRTWGWRNGTCPINDRGLYAGEMPQRGLQRQVQVGNATLTLFRLQDCYDVIAALLAHGKDGIPSCSRCPIRPRRVRQTVESDWDAEVGELRSDSEAWTY